MIFFLESFSSKKWCSWAGWIRFFTINYVKWWFNMLAKMSAIDRKLEPVIIFLSFPFQHVGWEPLAVFFNVISQMNLGIRIIFNMSSVFLVIKFCFGDSISYERNLWFDNEHEVCRKRKKKRSRPTVYAPLHVRFQRKPDQDLHCASHQVIMSFLVICQ